VDAAAEALAPPPPGRRRGASAVAGRAASRNGVVLCPVRGACRSRRFSLGFELGFLSFRARDRASLWGARVCPPFPASRI